MRVPRLPGRSSSFRVFSPFIPSKMGRGIKKRLRLKQNNVLIPAVSRNERKRRGEVDEMLDRTFIYGRGFVLIDPRECAVL